MINFVYHKIRRTDWHHVRHTFIVDVGTPIDIHLIEVSNMFENCILEPPFPKTRYFEIEIDELRDGTHKAALIQNIFPVHAKRKPDWFFLRFRLKRGGWTITERIQFPTDTGEAQWLYTDDFNILSLSSGGRYDLPTLTNLIAIKLKVIVQSFHEGNRIASEFENQISCRNAFDVLFGDGVDAAFRDAVIYQDYGFIVPESIPRDTAMASGEETCSGHLCRAGVSIDKAASLYFDINEIEELRDLSWLSN